MTFLLDTNACIRYLNGRSPKLRQRLNTAGDDQVAVCSVVKAELFFGAAKSREPAKTLMLQEHFLSRFRSLPFDTLAAHVYGPLRKELEDAGTPIGANDLLIAATAVANRLVLATHNVSEFKRVPNLQWEDWEV